MWLLGDNLWFNRDIIFANLGWPHLWISGSIVLFSIVLAVTFILLVGELRTNRFPLLLALVLLSVFIIYSNNSLIWYLSKHFTTSFGQIFVEGYIPEFLITLVYSLLPEYALLSYLKRTGAHEGHLHPSLRRAIRGRIRMNASGFGRGKSLRGLLVASFIMLLCLLPIFANFPSYVYGVSPFSGFGYAVQVDAAQSRSLVNASAYLQRNPDGDVFWFPQPPYYGAYGPLVARSYSYPLGSDGPASTELFSYLVGNHPTSLINSRGEDYELARMLSIIGVKYLIFYGKGLARASPLVNSKYFSLVLNNTNLLIYKNDLYHGMVTASSDAIIVSGGLRVYASFLRFEPEIYGDSTQPIPFMADTEPFLPLNASYSLLTDNVTQLFRSLIVMQGSEYLHFPFEYISEAEGWQGGDIADAGGYNWNGFAGGLANYTWQSTYTVSDGVIFTFKNGATISFPANITPGENVIMIRLFELPSRPSGLSVTLGDVKYNVTLPPSPYPRFTWIYLGEATFKGSEIPV
ncbi:MAG: hypothetical protein ACP5UD_09955, partial [Conexivisphaera sp.]